MAAVVAEQLKRRQSGFWDPPLGHGQAAASRMGRQGTRKQRPLTKRVSGPVRGRGVSQSRCPPAPRLRPGRGKLSQDHVAFHRTRLGRQQCDLANRSLPGPQARSAQRGDRASSPARPAAVGTEGACVSGPDAAGGSGRRGCSLCTRRRPPAAPCGADLAAPFTTRRPGLRGRGLPKATGSCEVGCM